MSTHSLLSAYVAAIVYFIENTEGLQREPVVRYCLL